MTFRSLTWNVLFFSKPFILDIFRSDKYLADYTSGAYKHMQVFM
jgi:hypothetical protein